MAAPSFLAPMHVAECSTPKYASMPSKHAIRALTNDSESLSEHTSRFVLRPASLRSLRWTAFTEASTDKLELILLLPLAQQGGQ